MKRNLNSITDVEGVLVGHAQNENAGTGCTAILFPKGAVAGADVRGGAPGTRETDALNPENLINAVHGIYVSGGSAFGLAGADGVMRWLAEQKIGLDTGSGLVPIVPGAVLFDLAVGNGAVRPDREMGYAAAAAAASSECRCGNIGAGMGATAGKHFGMRYSMKTGIGTASLMSKNIIVGALVAVNPVGDVIDPSDGSITAGAYDRDKKIFLNITKLMLENPSPSDQGFPGNTTIGIIATNAALTKAQARKIAMMTHDGFARTISPIHTMFDGDSIFCASLGKEQADISVLGVMASEVMIAAIGRAVKETEGRYGIPCYRDVYGA